MCGKLSIRLLLLTAIGGGIATVASADPQVMVTPPAPPGYLLVHEELWTHLMDETGRHFDRARDAFLNGHYRTSAIELRKAAVMMRIEASNGQQRADTSLVRAAHEVEALAQSMLSGKSTDSIDRLDDLSAHSLSVLAKHAQWKASVAWNTRHSHRSGHYLRAAADNLERAAFRARLQMTAATSNAIRNARVLSEKLVDGTDNAVDEINAGIASIGHQIEHFEHVLMRRPE